MELQASMGLLGAEGGCGVLSLLLPSPQSETVTHELEELTLQPLNERKNVLQLRLQQRRTREELVDQGIMPSLKSPAAFHGQIRSLERARTETFLKHKIRSRPERAELVRMHILQETGAEPSLQATQMRLKRARLADNLNEKISQRPGPMELVEKNILPVDSSVKEAIIGQVNYPKVLDEDSCDGKSPEQPASQESQSSAPSPAEVKVVETSALAPPPPPPLPPPPPAQTMQAVADFLKAFSSKEQLAISQAPPTALPITAVILSKAGPTLVKHSQPKMASEKSRSKKSKEPKSRVKKLKYHQYVPPDHKMEASEAPMDCSYARLLQQQQLFLQLQILSQQQQHYNYQTILPAPLKPVAEGQGGTSIVVSLPATPTPQTLPPPSQPAQTPSRPCGSLSNRRPGVLPANLEEMKVAELKVQLKLRGLPVSGTKTDLMERLKPFQDSSAASTHTPAASIHTPAASTHISAASTHTSSASTHTPAASTHTSVPIELSNGTPATLLLVQQRAPEGPDPPLSPARSEQDATPEETDRRLHDKEQQIEELMRKLEQEQRLVEALKMQLEVEKRSQDPPSVTCTTTTPSLINSTLVKLEGRVLANCSSTSSPLHPQGLPNHLATVVKLEDVTVSAGRPVAPQTHVAPQAKLFSQVQQQGGPCTALTQPGVQQQPQQQFFISHRGAMSQVLGPAHTLLGPAHTLLGPAHTLLSPGSRPTTQIILPVSLPANAAAAVQLPSASGSLQPWLPATVSNPAPGLVQASLEQRTNHSPLMQTLAMCASAPVGLENHNRPSVTPQCFLSRSPQNHASPRASPNHGLTNGSLNKSPCFPQQTLCQRPKTKDPPRYEDAIKQRRNQQLNTNQHLNTISQVPTATSQQMDDLFDILIESGEMSPFIQGPYPLVQQGPHPSLSKGLPVRANVSTLPVNTAFSRPPPHIQVAPPPALGSLSEPGLSSLASDPQLEAFLERTLGGTTLVSDPRTLGLMEELQAQLMEQQPYSPMDTSDLSFCDSSPASLHTGLSDPGLDNMEWLDLTAPPGPPGGLSPLGIPSDFLDTQDLQLHWE